MSREPRHRDLREPLHAWDPLREHPLSPERSQRMRERLAETLDPGVAPARHRSWRSSSVWVPQRLAIAAAVAVLVALASWWLQSEDTRAPSPGPRPRIAESADDGTAASAPAAVTDPEEATTAGPAEQAAAQRPAIGAEPQPALRAPRTPRVAAVPSATSAPPAASPVESPRPARRLQFRSPRGTRIYWTLDPDFDDSFAARVGE